MLTFPQIVHAAALVAAEFPITRVTLFGSYAEGRSTKDSDVDLLIEFRTAAVSLLLLCAVKHRFEDLLGVSVDVIHAPIPEGALIEPGKQVEIYAA